MPKLPIIKARELIRVLQKLGFFLHHQVGSHAQFKHPDGRRVTVPIHPGNDMNRKTLKGIIDDLNIAVEDFISLLKE